MDTSSAKVQGGHASAAHGRYHRIVGRDRSEDGPAIRPLDLIVAGAWLGLLAGVLELGAIFAQATLHPLVTPESLRTNRHLSWMVPVADLGLLMTVGLTLAPLGARRPRRRARLALLVLMAMSALAPLLAIRGLHPGAAVILALGIACRATGPMARLLDRSRRASRFGLPVVLALMAVLVGLDFQRLTRAEARHLAALPAANRDAPNVILLVLDTVRAESLGLYGYDRETTPNLRRLADRGITFDEARSTSPWTLTSHVSMFTGRWPHETSASVNTPLNDRWPTLAEFLSDRGYMTAGFVANTFFCNAQYGIARGFAHYEDYERNTVVSPIEIVQSAAVGRVLVSAARAADLIDGPHLEPRKSAERINADLFRWLDRQAGLGRPFFAFLNDFDAHAPYQPPAGHEPRFGNSTGGPRVVHLTPQMLRELNPIDPTPEQAERLQQQAALLRDSYDECIASIDEQIGKLFEELDRRGLRSNTWVIITSDHGEHFGEHRLFGHGGDLYRQLIHVPLVLIPPSGHDGPWPLRISQPVSLRELPATVAELVDPGSDTPFPGRSLSRFWRSGSVDPEPGVVFAEVDLKIDRSSEAEGHAPALRGVLRAVIAEQKTYIRNGDGVEELYALDGDPTEERNLVASPGSHEILRRFRVRLDRILSGASRR